MGIASKADFEAAGVDRLFFLSSLKFSLELDNPKGPLIRIRTDAPVREPYLNFLLEVQWPNGRVLREYTLLMDLPAFKDSKSTARVIKGAETPVIQEKEKPKPAPLDVQALEAELAAVEATSVVAPVAIPAAAPQKTEAASPLEETPVTKTDTTAAETAPKDEQPLDSPAQQAAIEEEKPSAAVKPAEEPLQYAAPVQQEAGNQAVVPVYSSAPAEGDYTTQKGDNLWSIAMKYRQNDGVTVQQSMLAIQRLNPQAFIQGNINLLKKGKVLRMPSYDDLTDMTSREAVAEVRRQNVEWSGNADGRKNTPASEQIDATHQEIAAADTAPANDEEGHLKLSVPGAVDGSAAGKASGAEALQNELSITMEELDRNKREKGNITSQLSGLDDQTKTMQQMLEVRSAELAALQAALAKKAQTKNEQSLSETQGASVAPAGQEGEVSDQTVLSEASVEKAVENTQPVAPTETPVVVEEQQATEEKSTAEKSGILDQLQDNLVWIAAGVLTLILLIFAAMKLRNRKPAMDLALQEEAAETDIETLDEEANFDDVDDVVSSLEDSLDMDNESFDEPALESKPETSDAIGEADIYISFGTYDKAESLLKNAISSEPKRTDLRLKLLEVYVGMDNLKAFDKQLSELTNLRDTGATERAHEMRNKISGAEDDLISSAPTAVTAAVTADDLDFDLDLSDDDVAGKSDSGLGDSGLDFDLDLDLDLDESPDATQKSAKVNISDAPTVQQRAIDLSEMQTAVSPAVKVAEARTEARESLDLDLSGLDAELEEFDAMDSTPTATSVAVAMDAPTPATGLDEEFDFLADADEAATKLDLARAYIDMGDKEGAKDILQEVIEEGQDAQKSEARKLLEGIS